MSTSENMSERETCQFYKGLSWKVDLFMLSLPPETKTQWIVKEKKKRKGEKAKMPNTEKNTAIEFCVFESL